jgi:hypothetical protein
MPIGSLNTATPSGGEVVGTSGPSELKGIKTEIRASFPNFTPGNDVCTRSAPQLNDTPGKSAAETITGPWSFTGNPTKNGWSIANVNEATAIATAAASAAVAAYAATIPPPAYGAMLAISQNVIPTGGTVVIPLNTAVAGPVGTTLDAVTDYDITVGAAGVYRVDWSVAALAAGTSGGLTNAYLRKNGAVSITESGAAIISLAAGALSGGVGMGFISLTAGDALSLCFSGGTAGGTLVTNASLRVERIA